MKKVLITGFGEFTQAPVENASRILVGMSQSWKLQHVSFTRVILPVEYTAAEHILLTLLSSQHWDAIICFGVIGKTDSIIVETIAQNLDHAVTPSGETVPDNAGDVRVNHTINPKGAYEYATLLPVDQLLQMEHVCEGTVTGGHYLCNHVHYVLLHYLYCTGQAIPAGFIHIPMQLNRQIENTVKNIIKAMCA